MPMKKIVSVLKEERVFPPPQHFVEKARIRDKEEAEHLRKRAKDDPEGFWGGIADGFRWSRRWDKVLEWDAPWSKWFVGGKTNVAENCLDRHLPERAEKTALIWVAEDGETRKLTYADLHREVCRFSNVLSGLGVRAGDRVMVFLPMVPEAVVTMLACARIGAVHSLVFAGFSAEALAERTKNAGAKLIVTADGGWRRGKTVALKEIADVAAAECPGVERVVVVRRTGQDVDWKAGRDAWWHDLMSEADDRHAAAAFDAEHPLYVLYTSGTTGKPKGIEHVTGGYMVGVGWTARWVFDLKEDDVLWCTADVAWVTGHSYVVYGPLLNGATTLIYEGVPDHPDHGRYWRIVEEHKVSVFYTAPTLIRAFYTWGDEWIDRSDISSLRLLGTVGEPINPEVWMWYREKIGGGRCPIVDTWWQTETGAIMISPLPGVTALKPGSCTRPLPGIEADVVTMDGKSCAPGEGGYLVVKRPWPSMLKTVHGDPDRYVKTYFSEIPGWYFSGDAARKDEDGYFWIMGRVDDVIDVSGHHLGTMEIESALVSHPMVAEAAVVGRPDELKGNEIVAFVTLKKGAETRPGLADELREHVAKEIGKIARPKEIRFTDVLPKTRSGKIVRRLLKEIVATGSAKGDASTLEDAGVLDRLASGIGS